MNNTNQDDYPDFLKVSHEPFLWRWNERHVIWIGEHSLTRYKSKIRCSFWVWILLICCLSFHALIKYSVMELLICAFNNRHMYSSICIGLFAFLFRFVTSSSCCGFRSCIPTHGSRKKFQLFASVWSLVSEVPLVNDFHTFVQGLKPCSDFERSSEFCYYLLQTKKTNWGISECSSPDCTLTS